MFKKKNNNKKETNKLEKIIHKINIFNKLNQKEKHVFNFKELLNKIKTSLEQNIPARNIMVKLTNKN